MEEKKYFEFIPRSACGQIYCRSCWQIERFSMCRHGGVAVSGWSGGRGGVASWGGGGCNCARVCVSGACVFLTQL